MSLNVVTTAPTPLLAHSVRPFVRLSLSVSGVAYTERATDCIAFRLSQSSLAAPRRTLPLALPPPATLPSPSWA